MRSVSYKQQREAKMRVKLKRAERLKKQSTADYDHLKPELLDSPMFCPLCKMLFVRGKLQSNERDDKWVSRIMSCLNCGFSVKLYYLLSSVQILKGGF